MHAAAADLAGLLAAHAAADALEATHLERMLALSRTPEPADPFARDHFDPGHFTASAFVLSPDATSLLLIFHAKLGLWLQPGGHFDPEDASVAAAARREVEEETGLATADLEPSPLFPALLDVDIHRIPPNPKRAEPAHEHFDARVLLQARTFAVAAATDALAARWVPFAEVPAAGTDESVLRALRKLLDSPRR